MIINASSLLGGSLNSKCDSKLHVVAFHTMDKLYTEEAKRMYASAKKLGLNIFIQQYKSKGDWVKNAAIKAQFLLDCRLKFSGPILYVDVDALFHNDPTEYLLNLDCDIAVHFDCQDHHLMSGTILLNETPKTEELLRKWVELCHNQLDMWDQKALELILEENPDIRCSRLPVVFCWVFDRVYNFSFKGDSPIYIEHLQASRAAKAASSFWRKFFRKKKGLRRREKRIREIERTLGIDRDI